MTPSTPDPQLDPLDPDERALQAALQLAVYEAPPDRLDQAIRQHAQAEIRKPQGGTRIRPWAWGLSSALAASLVFALVLPQLRMGPSPGSIPLSVAESGDRDAGFDASMKSVPSSGGVPVAYRADVSQAPVEGGDDNLLEEAMPAPSGPVATRSVGDPSHQNRIAPTGAADERQRPRASARNGSTDAATAKVVERDAARSATPLMPEASQSAAPPSVAAPLPAAARESVAAVQPAAPEPAELSARSVAELAVQHDPRAWIERMLRRLRAVGSDHVARADLALEIERFVERYPTIDLPPDLQVFRSSMTRSEH